LETKESKGKRDEKQKKFYFFISRKIIKIFVRKINKKGKKCMG